MFSIGFISLPGWQELMIILVLALLLFGRRIPQSARSIGQSVVEFRRGLRGEPDGDVKRRLDQGTSPD